jgi:hypothetical protein
MGLHAIAFASAALFLQAPLRQIEFLIGSWTGSLKTASGTVAISLENKRTYRDSFVSSTRRASGPGVISANESCYIWWDPAAGAFRSWAASDLSDQPREEVGKLKDSSLAMVSLPWTVRGVAQTTMRTFTPLPNGKLRLKLDVREGDKWISQAETDLVRAK